MKFLLQIEVDAPEHTGNPDFPRAVHGIQRLQDWLQAARQVQYDFLMDALSDGGSHEAYRAAVKREAELITAAIRTVKEIV